MFTGLIQDIGEVVAVERKTESSLLTIKTELARELKNGDSIAINGTCLTAIQITETTFSADVMVQTLKLSSLGDLKLGDKVNAELATRADARLGGHIVQGHVDAVGSVKVNQPGEKWQKFVIQIPQVLQKYVVNQGSICVDGDSLTVGEIQDQSSEVTLWLIPETLAKTTLGMKKSGDRVNIEVDVLAKYIERLLQVSQKIQTGNSHEGKTE